MAVAVRVGQGMTHAGLGCEVNYPLRPMLFEQILDGSPIGHIALYECKPIKGPELLQPSTLQLDIIIRVQVIEAYDLVASGEKTSRRVKADEAGGACDKNFHCVELTKKPQ